MSPCEVACVPAPLGDSEALESVVLVALHRASRSTRKPGSNQRVRGLDKRGAKTWRCPFTRRLRGTRRPISAAKSQLGNRCWRDNYAAWITWISFGSRPGHYVIEEHPADGASTSSTFTLIHTDSYIVSSTLQLSGLMSVQPSTNDTDASDELARFREEWKEEVRRKKAAAGAGSLQMQTQSVGPLDVTSFKPNNLDAIVQGHELPRAGTHSSQVNVKQILRATDTTSAPLGPMLQRAVELYRRAVVCEQQSNLDEALKLYRTAFRIDPNVDRAYHKIEAQFDVATNVSVAQQPAHATSSTKRSSIDGVTHSLKSLDVHSAVVPVAEGVAIPPGSLASIMAEWPALLEFLPEDEGKPVHIQKLPVEVLLLMLRKLGTTALERYALVCRKARFLTLDMGIWKCVIP